MGGYQNLKSVKLSDFIDERFLEDLVRDIEEDVGATKSDKKPLSQLMEETAEKSSIMLPTLQSESTAGAQANKRKKTSSMGDLQLTHLIMTPFLALILNQTEYLLNPDWRRRQIAACNLRGIFNLLHRKQIDSLDYFTV